jgi:hypothetical protein
MTLPAAPLPISFSQIQTELNGSNPISLSEYYRGGNYVAVTLESVPVYQTIKASNFRGLTRQIISRSWYIGQMPGIYSGGTDADDTYFGGSMAGGSAEYRNSNTYYEVTAPKIPDGLTQDPIYLNIYGGWGASLAAGYSYIDPPWWEFRGRRTFYDQISQPGLRVYRVEDGAYIGGINGDATVVQGAVWGVRYCNNELKIQVEPNKKYRIYYSVYMYRASDQEVSFGYSTYIAPTVYFRT